MGVNKKSDKDELSEDDDWDVEDEAADAEVDDLLVTPKSNGPRARDWRDLERFKEERELKKLMEADDWPDEL